MALPITILKNVLNSQRPSEQLRMGTIEIV